MATRRFYHSDEVAIALALGVFAQLAFGVVLAAPTPPAMKADISDEASKPIAVSITPILSDAPLLKLGSQNPSKLPSAWTRAKPIQKTADGPLPSPQAEATPEAIPKGPVSDGSVPNTSDAGLAPSEMPDASAAPASSEKGDPSGSPKGTETDPAKGRALDMYRSQLASWFVARFAIRGKLPFETLKDLRASATVQVSSDRRVTSFTITRPSGDATFDAEVKATLANIQSSGALVPAPPPLYPDLFGTPFPVSFQCTVQKYCE